MSPDPFATTVFLISAFCAAGVLQSLWLKSSFSQRWAIPLDGGWTFRGRRVFGENKTWRGLVVMIPAVGVAFYGLASLRPALGSSITAGLWPLDDATYLLLGCAAGLGYVLGELPNSFSKRQLDILPGQPPRQPLARAVCFVVDQADSVVGALLALTAFVAVPTATWIAILLVGPVVHFLFNIVLMLIGVKAKAA